MLFVKFDSGDKKVMKFPKTFKIVKKVNLKKSAVRKREVEGHQKGDSVFLCEVDLSSEDFLTMQMELKSKRVVLWDDRNKHLYLICELKKEKEVIQLTPENNE